MVEILLDNKNGNVWDITHLVSNLTWTTSRIGKPASLDLTFIRGGLYEERSFEVNNGDIVRFRKEDENVFYGYVFSIDRGIDESVRLKAYDQVRYLLSNDYYRFTDVTATQIIQTIAEDNQLKVGTLDDTGFRIPTLLEEDKKLLDIICKAIDLTLISTKRIYVFFDDYGELSLRSVENMRVDFALGEKSLLYDYQYSRSIDKETYNRVKLSQENKEENTKKIYIAQDSANIAKWGQLQLYKTVDEQLNYAQISEMLDQLIQLKNREQKTLQVDALGDIRLRAGCIVPILIDELDINQTFLVDQCSHKIEGANHTMTLELRVI
ncbi:hypothetical protein [Paenibacillus sp. J2TS4]|uniref:XkdQ/YqbQ family protein n=1 Tax=Paenibacillus sp. J2TS4 TaxID=2807194 RepID=UPI001B0A48FC|nr:hypothetical protein [Paenibacillus sp. J2TS4]GIP35510.1 hypothetical protein J2TS4_47200 [Paenibacillus sp. J2TS4]